MPDLGVYGRQNTLLDLQRLQQDFELKKQLALQSVQAGLLDAETKKNAFATQLISAGAAGGQQSYDAAKAKLAQLGIDPSGWDADVNKGAMQAQAARVAQSPYGALMNLGLKAESNQIAAANAFGNTASGASPISSSILSAMSGLPTAAPIADQMPAPAAAPIPKVSAADLAPPVTIPTKSEMNMPSFSFRPQQPGETAQAYNQARSTALEAWKADPAVIAATNAAQTAGKAEGEAQALYAEAKANLPRLKTVAQELSDLGKKATYTYAGQAKDFTLRQLGLGGNESAVARTNYIAKVDNEVLPILRQTFGAQFTENEGKSLKVTLGDPDKTPEEKDAILKSFIESKMGQIESLARRVGEKPNAPAAQLIDPAAARAELERRGVIKKQ